MKSKLLVLCTLFIIALFAVTAVASAAVSQATINAIIRDAADGQIDGNWTAAEIQAALRYLENNPTSTQYSDYAGDLEEYLASQRDPGGRRGSGQLAFTGAPVGLLLAAGAALSGGGLWLRRRR